MLAERYRDDGRATLSLNGLQVKTKESIQQKIKEGIYIFESVPCGICDGEDFELLSQKDRYGLYVSAVVCKSCGLIQLNPRMNWESYSEFYKDDYRKLYEGESLPTDEFFVSQYIKGKNIYSYLHNNGIIKEPNSRLSVLEIGCGAGGILQYFKDNGCRVKGIDLGEEYIEFGREKYGLDLSVGTLLATSLEFEPDIIIYSHVLEHILSVSEELKNIKEKLSSQGVIYIEVPGVKNLFKSYEMNFLLYLQNAHVYYFSLATLKRLMGHNDFEMVSGDENIRSVFRRKPQTALEQDSENDYPSVVEYLQELEKSRKFLPLTPYLIKALLRKWIIKLLRCLRLDQAIRKIYWKYKLGPRFSTLAKNKFPRQKTD